MLPQTNDQVHLQTSRRGQVQPVHNLKHISTGSKFFQTSLDDLPIADYQREELSHSAQDFFSTPTLLSLFVPFLQIAPFCIQAAPSMCSPFDQPDIWPNMTMQAMLTFEYRQIAPVATQLQTRHNAMLQ